MKIKVLYHVPMGSNGKFILRSMQDNNEMPLLDLFVRESLQNSLDAGIGTEKKYVNVNYETGTFNIKELNKIFEKSTELLDKAAESNLITNNYLLIRDSNTVGLNGRIKDSEYNEDEDFENCRKLIYEFGEPQSQKESGGSWGLGKTIYFRMGIGIVLYYSQFKDENGAYHSRLAATIVENNKAIKYIPKENPELRRIGIAFWGKNEGDYSIPLDEKNDMQEIEYILSIFGIKKFQPEETGTCVIIPYIDLNKCLLCGQFECKNSDGDIISLPWANDFDESLCKAIQRWYFPRIQNSKYSNGERPFLKVSVNNKIIDYDSFSTLFKIYWELYRYAEVGYEPPKTSFSVTNNLNFYSSSIKYNYTQLGTFAYTVIDNTNQLIPGSPYNFLNFNSEKNYPIVAFVRKPGQIITYNLGLDWLSQNYELAPNNYIIGIFVLDSSCVINGINLEEYIKSGEQSAHTKWIDQPLENQQKKQNYVGHIQSKIRTVLTDKFITDKKTDISFNPSLYSSKFSWLLPSMDSGHGTAIAPGQKKIKSQKKQVKPRPRTSKMELQLLPDRPSFKNQTLEIKYILFPGDSPDNGTIGLYVDVEGSKPIALKQWADEDNLAEPFELIRIEHNNILSPTKFETTKNKKPYAMSFNGNNIPKDGLIITIVLRIIDKGYSPVIELS